MAYIINQYNKSDNNYDSMFMTSLSGGLPIRLRESINIDGINNQVLDSFANEGVFLMNNILEVSKNYYFHGKIKKLVEPQTFYIYLVDRKDLTLTSNQQYIKTITVAGGEGWADIEFIFTPLAPFNTILFKLHRTEEDYIKGHRYATIIYQELSLINNLLPNLDVKSLYKIGVQSRPGFLMCINGEEIRTNRTGIYELKDGFITVTFFSAVAAAKDPSNLQEQLKEIKPATANHLASICLFSVNANRTIDRFSLDYISEGGEY